jgi:hypothetical protein
MSYGQTTIGALTKHLRRTKLAASCNGIQSPIRKSIKPRRTSPHTSPLPAPFKNQPRIDFETSVAPIHAIRPYRVPAACGRPTVSDVSHEEVTRNIGLCKDACNVMRSTIHDLVTKIDFVTVDSCAHEALQPLRHSLDMIRELAQAFLALLLEVIDDSFRCPFQSGYDGLNAAMPGNRMDLDTNALNHLNIKTCLVYLRALCDKFPSEISAKSAAKAAPMITQGILEQFLSWSSEADTVFDALKSSLKKQSKMYTYATKPSPLEPRRSERSDDARLLDRRGGGRVGPAQCARVRVNLRKVEDAMRNPATSRLHRLRPPRLIIPEGSS